MALPKLRDTSAPSLRPTAMPVDDNSAAIRLEKARSANIQGAMDMGTKLMLERRKAEADTYFNNSTDVAQIELRTLKKDMASEYNGTDYKGFTDNYISAFEKKTQELIKNAPNSAARDRIEQWANQNKEVEQVKMEAFENERRSQFFISKDQETRDLKKESLYSDPSFELAADSIIEDEFRLETTNLYNPAQKKQIREKNSQYVTNTLDGLLDSNTEESLVEAENFLNGAMDEDYPGLRKMLSPKQLSKYKNVVGRKRERLEKENISGLINQSQGLVKRMEFEGRIDQGTKKRVEEAIKGLKLVEDKDDRAVEMRNLLENQLDMEDMKKEVRHMDYKQLLKFDPTEGLEVTKDAESRSELMARRARSNYVNSVRKQMTEDPGAYVMATSPHLQEGSKEFYEAQRNLGVPRPRYFSDNTAEQLASTLKLSPSPMSDLKEFRAEYPSEALRDIIDRDTSLANYYWADKMQNPDSQNVFLNLKPREVKSRFKDSFGTVQEGIIEKNVNTKFKEIDRVWGMSNISPALKDRVKAQAMDMMLRDIEGNPERAADKAYKLLVSSNMSIVQSGNTSFEVMKNEENNMPAIKAFADMYGDQGETEDILQDLANGDLTANLTSSAYQEFKEEKVLDRVEIDPNTGDRKPIYRSRTDEEISKAYLEQVKGTLRWVRHGDRLDAMVIVKGLARPLRSGTSTISVSIDDINYTGKFAEALTSKERARRQESRKLQGQLMDMSEFPGDI